VDDECPKCKCPAGIPAWVLTFADLMSLLMCFFVLLLSFSEMDVQKFKQIAGSLKVAFGVQRIVEAVEIPKGTNIVAKEFSPSPPQPTVINEVRQKTIDETNQELILVKKIQGLQAEQTELTKKMGQMDSQSEEAKEIQEKIKALEAEETEAQKKLEELQNQIGQLQQAEIQEQASEFEAQLKQEIENELIEIETNQESFLIRIRDKGSFSSGTAELTDDFIDILEVIKRELEQIKGGIIVAGHTDNIPISTRAFRSNWDLSAERAVSVVEELLYESTLTQERVSIQAFGESRPLADNETPENRAKNRRVEIIVSKKPAELNSLDKDKEAKSKEQSEGKADEKPEQQEDAPPRREQASEQGPETSSNETVRTNQASSAEPRQEESRKEQPRQQAAREEQPNRTESDIINIERPEPAISEVEEQPEVDDVFIQTDDEPPPSFINF